MPYSRGGRSVTQHNYHRNTLAPLLRRLRTLGSSRLTWLRQSAGVSSAIDAATSMDEESFLPRSLDRASHCASNAHQSHKSLPNTTSHHTTTQDRIES